MSERACEGYRGPERPSGSLSFGTGGEVEGEDPLRLGALHPVPGTFLGRRVGAREQAGSMVPCGGPKMADRRESSIGDSAGAHWSSFQTEAATVRGQSGGAAAAQQVRSANGPKGWPLSCPELLGGC